ncbi:cryptococcal mannosyltransferase 1-domain-containing protein [Favolaschia claudopus]|uniref:Cryptococcal mannosyltransferase 1-domain-containing protein n=1 Tax=Favolaschia claudopus TaxID=2862362 RepID=A0AAW0CYG5_9AGAR
MATRYPLQLAAQQVGETFMHTRLISRWRIPPPILLVLRLALWIGVALGRIFLRFAHPIISLAVLYQIWRHCYEYYRAKLGGRWGPAFPLPRTCFVITLAAIPIWGACMAVLMLMWPILLWFSNLIRSRFSRVGKYEPIAVDLDDLESPEDAGYTQQRDGRVFSKPTGRNPLKIAVYSALLAAYVSVALFGVHMLRTYELPIDHRFKERVEHANRNVRPEGYGTGEKIYIAAMFYNNAGVLPYWIQEITKLIHYLGPENVFVSIVESNSGDNTADLLEGFDKTLQTMQVKRRILTRDNTITRPESMATAPPRIQFLAAVRNQVLEPLVKNGGYNRIIFSNDIFIEAESIVELLDTKGGDFDMACGLDLAYWGLYDQWVLRDRLGRLASTLWPYFLEDTGYRAVMADEPAPVFACWNGIIAVRAEPFLPLSLRTVGQLSTNPLSRPLVSTHPAYGQPLNMTPAETPPLRFRSSVEGECFSSECFLLPYDLRRQFDMQNIYVNPRVINSYGWEWYVWFKYVTRHWAVKWWIERVENGNGIHLAKIVLGDPARVWQFDGSECHPW